ncbi:LOW QUALITY PROTEIN: uncharacterized protein LOC135476597 [Liolophura sinensis]|uniref:LOW QUALITY PROTEIN: uncharacterized protein LOC135476597 n=1 Tax=Liolophura sinensis TaxID=3198878 RepID=UPI00315887A3
MSQRHLVPSDSYCPFGEPWLDSCFQQTLLPNAPWHKLEEDVAKALAQKVQKQFNHPERREMLFKLLGKGFINSYFPSEMPHPQLLEPPQMSAEERRRLEIEAKSWLLSQAYKCVNEMGYPSVITGSSDGDTTSKELADFLRHTFSIFSNGLDRELYWQEEELAKKKKLEIQQLSQKEKQVSGLNRVPVPSVIKSSSSASTVRPDLPSTSHIKANLHNLEGDPPPLWGLQSDKIGKAIVQVLQRDPRKFDLVVGRLHGRQLPGILRSYIWADVLFRDQRKRMKGVNVERVVRERFAKAVQKGAVDLGIKRATHSPITGLIENAVIEKYSRTVGMVPHNQQAHLREAARVLNVLYVYDRSYEPYLIDWLFPLQLALRDSSDVRGESLYELAMYLDLLNDSCFPTWPQVFAIAKTVLEALHREDAELYDHLREIAFINIQFNPKEFLVQLMHQEKAKAQTLLSASPSVVQSDPLSAKLLADPLIFLRKWIGECFVSVLDTPAILYVWDQCFMQGWKASVLQNFCLVMLELLRSRFMMASDYRSMKEVFFNEPCKLYTMDIQMAWIHLENGKPLSEIPAMNRQRPSTAYVRVKSASSVTSVDSLKPFGLKYVRLKLIFPAESFDKEPQLSQCDVSDLKLNVSVYFGTVRLATQPSTQPPLEVRSDTDSYGERTLYAKFPVDKFEFDALDLSQLDVEKELGGTVYAMVEVEYSPSAGDQANNSTTLGWSKVPLYDQVSANQWTLLTGNNTYPLHPGKEKGSKSTPIPGTSAEYETDLLGYSSELSLIIYDLDEEPYEEPADIIPVQLPPQDTREPSPPRKPSPVLTTPASAQTPDVDVGTPKPPVKQTPGPEHKRRRPKDIIPPPDTPGPVDPSPWVAHRTKTASWNPSPTDVTEAFDLYVDSVRFIPDNASVVKVTGRVLNTGDITSPPDIKALPELSESARCPVFGYKLTVNGNNEEASGDMLILLRLYTVDVVTDMLMVVGSCILPVFEPDDTGKPLLRVGGHQLKFRNGMPPKNAPQELLKASDIDGVPAIPGCTILVRLMPHSENFVALPKYGKGYYKSFDCQPSLSEERIFHSYTEHMAYPRDFRQMIRRVQTVERVPPMSDDGSLSRWVDSRLDLKKNLPANLPAGHINILQCVRYRIKTGLSVRVNRAFGLEENHYVQCILRVIPGGLALDMEPTEAGLGGQEQWITLKHDYSSLLRSPCWIDPPQEIHPFYDENSCVLIQVIGLGVVYHPTRDHRAPGRLTGPEGQQLKELGEHSMMGWAVVPLFRGNSVQTGEHQVPLLRGRPSANILGDLTRMTPEEVIETHELKKPSKRLFPGHLSVTIWDNHFDFKDIPVMRTYKTQLASAGNLDLYIKAQKGLTGKLMASLVNSNMKSFEKSGPVFEKEAKFFEQIVTKTYYELVENALLEAGYGPLKTDPPSDEASGQHGVPTQAVGGGWGEDDPDSPPAFE